jgi:hypothetical protein
VSKSSKSSAPLADSATTRYTLLAFSTGQILEDHLTVSCYNLRPHELLELHNFGSDLRLPRDIVLQYIQPCFEARVRALRVFWKERASRGHGVDSPGKSIKPGSGTWIIEGSKSVGGAVISFEREKDRGRSWQKTKLEWKDRLLFVRNGVMTFCKDWGVSLLESIKLFIERNFYQDTSVQEFSLDSLIALQGAEHLKEMTPPHCDVPCDRILCCRFDMPSQGRIRPHRGQQSDGSMPSTVEDKGSANMDGRANVDFSELDGEWIVLEMLEDACEFLDHCIIENSFDFALAYAALVRILHRSASSILRSYFLQTPPNSASPTSPTFPPAIYQTYPRNKRFSQRDHNRILSSEKTHQYPEWRINVVHSARMAGVGMVSAAMMWILSGDKGRQDEARAIAKKRSFDAEASHGVDSDDSSSQGNSEMEWDSWSKDLERQKRVADVTPRNSKLQNKLWGQYSPTTDDFIVQQKRRALEPFAVVSSLSSSLPIRLSRPPDLERPYYHSWSARRPSATSTTTDDSLPEGGLEELRTNLGKRLNLSAAAPTSAEPSGGKDEASRMIGFVWKGKGSKAKEKRKAEDGPKTTLHDQGQEIHSESSPAVTPPRSMNPSSQDIPRVRPLTEKSRSSQLRHAWSLPTLTRSLKHAAADAAPEDDSALKTTVERDLRGSKGRGNSPRLLRRVSVKAGK